MAAKEQQCGCAERPPCQNSGLVIRHLQEYIKDKGLCNPSTRTQCENDVSDLSDADQGVVSPGATRKPNRKRKRANLTDVSCSSQSSGTCSPQNIPWCWGFIGRKGFESNDDKSDCSNRSKPHCNVKGYDTATTAIITDSEDDVYFPNDVNDFEGFEVEYEPPESNSEDEKDDDDDDEIEPPIIISSDEDPGAEGGDEFDEDDIDSDSDSEDAWACLRCKAMNHPMTRHCVQCWGKRDDCFTLLSRTVSAPVSHKQDDFTFQAPAPPNLCRSATVGHAVHIENSALAITSDSKNNWQIHAPIPTTAAALIKDCETSSRSSSSCSNTHHSCDSGIYVSSCETDNEHATQLSGTLEQSIHSAFTQNSNLATVALSKRHEGCSTADISQLVIATSSESKEDTALGTMSIVSRLESGTCSDTSQARRNIDVISNEQKTDLPTMGIIQQAEVAQSETAGSENLDKSATDNNTAMARTENSTNAATNDKSTLNDKHNEEVFSKDMCVICLSQPRNASIIHGRSGHQVCCITCANKLKANKKKCPVCRRKIHFVVKNFL